MTQKGANRRLMSCSAGASGTCTGRRKLCIQLAKVASDQGANTINYQISNHGTLRVQFLRVEDYILQSAGRRQPNLK
jgi:hypothetical protein